MGIYITRDEYMRAADNISAIDKLHSDTYIKMGESVKRDNDLRENPEYMELRVKAMYEIPGMKRALVLKYNQAIIIEEMNEYKNFDGNTVIIGSEVTIDFDGEKDVYSIFGTDDADINYNILSNEAPIVKAILGHKVGECVEFNDKKIKIIFVKKIENLGNYLKEIREEENAQTRERK